MASPGRAVRQSSPGVFNIADVCKANPNSNFLLDCDSSPSPVFEKQVHSTNNYDNIMLKSRDLSNPGP